jgi:hypothetical protein
MMVSRFLVLLAATSVLAACKPAPTTAPATDNNAMAAADTKAAPGDPIASAESAAPASIAHDAAIVTVDAKGAMTTLRAGKNGWTCMPDSPTTPGPDPMCMDGNAMKWAGAWMGHKPPPANMVGLMYMLEGGTDASNTDPYATTPTAGGDWVKTGPHLMVVGAPSLNAIYKGEAKPDTGQPYVMWGGTPYAHLMIPIH